MSDCNGSLFIYNDTTTTEIYTLSRRDALPICDPTAYETYWSKVGERSTITFTGDQSLSYFANAKNLCWFLEPKLEEEIRRLHHVVGNAKVDDHFIIVGNGSSQLIQAALYAVSPSDQPQPTSVVSAAPYYSVSFVGFQISHQSLFLNYKLVIDLTF